MKKRSRRLWGCLLLILVFVLALAGGAAWLWRQARSAPAWYSPPDPGAQPVATLAETVEYRMTEEFQKIRDEDAWTLRIHEEQVNAWLAARMPEWIAHEPDLEWPREFGIPQIRVDGRGIDLAIPVGAGGRSAVLIARLDPEIVGGQMHLNLERAGIGRLSLPGEPAQTLMSAIEQVAPGGALDDEAVQSLLSLLSGEQGISSLVDLSDGRRVELLDLTLADGMIELTSRTLPPESESESDPER
jgi:hypothetical protein